MNTKTLLTMKKRWWAGRDAPGILARSMSLGRRMKRDWQEALDKDLRSLMLRCLEKGLWQEP